MQLKPKRPPGRVDRKAAAYAAEIAQLRAEGYTYQTIREALADVGIDLSECALRREVRRHQRRNAPASSGSRLSPTLQVGPPLPVPQPPPTEPLAPYGSSGREIAEAFFNAHPSNPLIPIKETS